MCSCWCWLTHLFLTLLSLGRILPIPFILTMSSITFLVHLVTPPLISQFLAKTIVRAISGRNLFVCSCTHHFEQDTFVLKVGALASESSFIWGPGTVHIKELTDAKHKEDCLQFLCFLLFSSPTIWLLFLTICCAAALWSNFSWSQEGLSFIYLFVPIMWKLNFKWLHTCLFILKVVLLTVSGCFWC